MKRSEPPSSTKPFHNNEEDVNNQLITTTTNNNNQQHEEDSQKSFKKLKFSSPNLNINNNSFNISSLIKEYELTQSTFSTLIKQQLSTTTTTTTANNDNNDDNKESKKVDPNLILTTISKLQMNLSTFQSYYQGFLSNNNNNNNKQLINHNELNQQQLLEEIPIHMILPEELFALIFSYLDLLDFLSISHTCKSFRNICEKYENALTSFDLDSHVSVYNSVQLYKRFIEFRLPHILKVNHVQHFARAGIQFPNVKKVSVTGHISNLSAFPNLLRIQNLTARRFSFFGTLDIPSLEAKLFKLKDVIINVFDLALFGSQIISTCLPLIDVNVCDRLQLVTSNRLLKSFINLQNEKDDNIISREARTAVCNFIDFVNSKIKNLILLRESEDKDDNEVEEEDLSEEDIQKYNPKTKEDKIIIDNTTNSDEMPIDSGDVIPPVVDNNNSSSSSSSDIDDTTTSNNNEEEKQVKIPRILNLSNLEVLKIQWGTIALFNTLNFDPEKMKFVLIAHWRNLSLNEEKDKNDDTWQFKDVLERLKYVSALKLTRVIPAYYRGFDFSIMSNLKDLKLLEIHSSILFKISDRLKRLTVLSITDCKPEIIESLTKIKKLKIGSRESSGVDFNKLNNLTELTIFESPKHKLLNLKIKSNYLTRVSIYADVQSSIELKCPKLTYFQSTEYEFKNLILYTNSLQGLDIRGKVENLFIYQLPNLFNNNYSKAFNLIPLQYSWSLENVTNVKALQCPYLQKIAICNMEILPQLIKLMEITKFKLIELNISNTIIIPKLLLDCLNELKAEKLVLFNCSISDFDESNLMEEEEEEMNELCNNNLNIENNCLKYVSIKECDKEVSKWIYSKCSLLSNFKTISIDESYLVEECVNSFCKPLLNNNLQYWPNLVELELIRLKDLNENMILTFYNNIKYFKSLKELSLIIHEDCDAPTLYDIKLTKSLSCFTGAFHSIEFVDTIDVSDDDNKKDTVIATDTDTATTTANGNNNNIALKAIFIETPLHNLKYYKSDKTIDFITTYFGNSERIEKKETILEYFSVTNLIEPIEKQDLLQEMMDSITSLKVVSSTLFTEPISTLKKNYPNVLFIQ
ncbi:hypothetical protein ABK040_012634 [Willaertia magna]